jgi:nucleoside 2-deoxyribosyltransferase
VKIYVAAGSKTDRERARAFMAALREVGHEITFDWVEVLGTDHRSEAVAFAEIAAVRDADAVCFLVPASGSTGAGFEVGFAYAIGVPILAIGPHHGVFHFGVLLDEVESEADALWWLNVNLPTLRHSRDVRLSKGSV